MALYAVVIAIVVSAAIFTGIDVFLALKTARAAPGRKPRYFNIVYKPEHGTEFCRAHLVGKAGRIDNKVLYVVEIHPEDAAKARAWTVRKAELCGRQLLKKGRFYRYAFKGKSYMTKEPNKLKWGDRTAAKVDEAEYLIGIRLVGYTSLKDVILAEVHEVGTWHTPEDLMRAGGYVFMKKPRAGARYKIYKA